MFWFEFWFLPLILLNNFRIVFIFCINLDIDKGLLLLKMKGLGLIPLELFPFVILEKAVWFLLLILLNNFRNLFTFCIKVDIDEVSLLDKNKGLDVISLELFPFVILEKVFKFLLF